MLWRICWCLFCPSSFLITRHVTASCLHSRRKWAPYGVHWRYLVSICVLVFLTTTVGPSLHRPLAPPRQLKYRPSPCPRPTASDSWRDMSIWNTWPSCAVCNGCIRCLTWQLLLYLRWSDYLSIAVVRDCCSCWRTQRWQLGPGPPRSSRGSLVCLGSIDEESAGPAFQGEVCPRAFWWWLHNNGAWCRQVGTRLDTRTPRMSFLIPRVQLSAGGVTGERNWLLDFSSSFSPFLPFWTHKLSYLPGFYFL